MTTHETISEHRDVEPGSDRSFGLVVGAVLCAIGAYQYKFGSGFFTWVLVPGIGLVLLGFLFPKVLHPLNILWTKLGLLLGRIVTPIVMFLVFVLTVIPIGLLLRAFRKDLLRLKRNETLDSYWIERKPPGPSPESLKNQF